MQVNGKLVEFDEDGFMREPDLWDDSVATSIAREEGIDEMTDAHWSVVRFIREHWQANDLAPPVRLLCKESGVTVREMYKLFTAGPARGACRVAGLPKPDLLLYLRAPVAVLLERIRRRGRNMEASVTSEYLSLLETFYEEWMETFDLCPVLTISTEDLDFVHNLKHLDIVVQRIQDKLAGKEDVIFPRDSDSG